MKTRQVRIKNKDWRYMTTTLLKKREGEKSAEYINRFLWHFFEAYMTTKTQSPQKEQLLNQDDTLEDKTPTSSAGEVRGSQSLCKCWCHKHGHFLTHCDECEKFQGVEE